MMLQPSKDLPKCGLQHYRRRYDRYAGANIEISRRDIEGIERERCRLRSRGAAKHPQTMPAGPILFTSDRGDLCIRHNEIPKMTQITPQELAKFVCPQT